jgi:GNAT superfamily N-acetyltransferase
MEITVAKLHDIPRLCELLNSLFAQESEFTPNSEAQRKGLVEIISSPKVGDILVARKDGEIVGMLNLLYTISTALGERVTLLEDMVVSPNVRGQSIGSKLIDYAIEFAKEQGCKRITLLTDNDNKRAHKFYERHGFAKSSMIPFRLNLETKNNA